METHAHHLHKAPGKKWTHYLFEFFMLFLAVFCGFLAENRLNGAYASNIYTLVFHDRSIRQLLNSGNMRLIQQAVSDSIMTYYGLPKDDLLGQEKIYEEMSKRLVFFAEDIFDKSLSPLKMNADNIFSREHKPGKMTLMTNQKNILEKYAQTVLTTQSMLSVYLNMLFTVEDRSKKLLASLQKEY